jgi:hypothetical protein
MGDAPDGLRVGARLNHHDERIKELKKKVNQLEQHVGAQPEMIDLLPSNKEIRICCDGDLYTGIVLSSNKYRVKLDLGGGRHRTFNKGHIRWHEEV